MADPLALLARLKRESALLESVTESRTSAPDTALGAVEIDDQLVVSTLIRLKAEHGAQRTIKPQHVRAALALAGDPAFARDPSIKIEAARWAALGVPRGDARSRVKSYAAGVVKLCSRMSRKMLGKQHVSRQRRDALLWKRNTSDSMARGGGM